MASRRATATLIGEPADYTVEGQVFRKLCPVNVVGAKLIDALKDCGLFSVVEREEAATPPPPAPPAVEEEPEVVNETQGEEPEAAPEEKEEEAKEPAPPPPPPPPPQPKRVPQPVARRRVS